MGSVLSRLCPSRDRPTLAQQEEDRTDVHLLQSTSAQQGGERSDVHPPQSTSAQQSGNESDVHLLQSTSAQQGGETSDVNPPQSTSAQQSEEKADVHSPLSTSAQQGGDESQQGGERSDPPQSTSAQQSGNESDVQPLPSTSAQQGGERPDVHPPEPASAKQSRETSDVHPPEPASAQQSGATSDVHPAQSTSAQQSEERSDVHPPESTLAQQSGETSDVHPLPSTTVQRGGQRSDVNLPQSTSAQQGGERSHALQSIEVPSEPNEGETPISWESNATARAKLVSSEPMSDTLRAATLMSEEDKILLNSRLPTFTSKISIEDGMLLAHLRYRRALTQQQEENIKIKGDRSNQVRCLLDLLLKGDSNTLDKFIYSLRATGQCHLVDQWLRQPTGPDNWELINTGSVGLGATSALPEADTNLLERSRPRMMRDLNLANGDLLSELRVRDVLTREEEGYIKGIRGNANAVGHLIDKVLSRSPNSLDEFLHALRRKGFSDVVEYLRPTTTPDRIPFVREGLTELQEALKSNMQDKLGEWKTALEEGVSSQEGLLPYINQPCLFGPKSARQSVQNTVELVENSRPGDRLVIYGEAGQGKTTLLKHITRTWIEGSNTKLAEKFAYVFLIPLRLIGNISLLNILCDELGLVPLSNSSNLKEALDRNERKTLFLLDSFEELRGDVVKAKNTEIDDLITGRLFKNSTVVVTSRPDSRLKRAKDQTIAQLQDLPKNEVKEVIKRYFGGNKEAVVKVQRSFPAMAYLQRPINLALFIFIVTHNKHLTLAYTQAELFSLVLQYIMLAFAKKKKLEEFTPQPDSYITNRAIPRDIRRLFRDIAKKCYEEKKKKNVKLHIEDADDLKEYLDFGLFTAGPDTYTVLLPHRLFIEYFAAAHLAENPGAWRDLFEEIKEESERRSPRQPLTSVVRRKGLENVLRFAIALSPQPQLEQMCLQVGGLFVVERQKTFEGCDGVCSAGYYRLVNFEYYTELLRDCSDDSGKRILSTALLNAPIREVSDRVKEEDRSLVFWPYLDDQQRVTFLKQIHSLDLCVIDGRPTLSCTEEHKTFPIMEKNLKLVVALLYQYGCIIKADELDIGGKGGRHLDLPASVFARMSGVRHLRLLYCTLHEGLPDYMSDIDLGRSATLQLQHSLPYPTNSSLESVSLFQVYGLEHCDVITSSQCQLEVKSCGNVRARTLMTLFPSISELEFAFGWGKVVYETEQELTSWLSTVQTVRKLTLTPQHEGESRSLCRLLNILAESEVEKLDDLSLYRHRLLLNIRDTSDTVRQNNTLSGLWLEFCEGDVDLGQLFEVCSLHCPHLKKVHLTASNPVFDDARVESVRQLPGLEMFTLSDSALHTTAGRRLSEEEAKQLLHRLCPSAKIDVRFYPESDSGSGTED